MRRISCLVSVFWMLALGACWAQGTAPSPPGKRDVTVAVTIAPPFVMRDDAGHFSGMAIELWETMADSLGLRSDYRLQPSPAAALAQVQSGAADIAVGDITITAARLGQVDFTQPWYDAGLRIMIDETDTNSLARLWHGLRANGQLRVYAWLGSLMLLATLALTLFDRVTDPEYPREWHKGLAESFYAVMSVATSGKAPRKPIWGAFGRILAGLWMVCGVAMVAYVTSTASAMMTTNSLSYVVNSVADLPGRHVGVLAGTVGESWAARRGLTTEAFNDLPTAVNALVKGRVGAIVQDAPVLEYYDNSHPELPITEVGALFLPQKYGFVLPKGSALVRPVDIQILAARESGYLDKLKAKYFGVTP